MAKEKIDIDDVCSRIIAGDTYKTIAERYKMPLATFHLQISKPEYSARVREARLISAQTFVEKAEKVIEDAQNAFELNKARELAHHYRWKASKVAPKDYGDKVEVENKGDLTIKWEEVKTYDTDKKANNRA